jgi:serine/threonine-protein kinase
MPQAIELLQQAIAKDPKFVLAAALLGQAHMFVYFFAPDRTDARLTAAKAGADQALALQPDLGEAHFALALYWYWGFRDYARAQAELDLARKTLPHSFLVEQIGAAIARREGKWDQALEGLHRAQEFDPRNSSPSFEFGQTYAQLRRYAEADHAYARAAELSAEPALSQLRRAQNTASWKGDLGPLRATLLGLAPASDAYRTNRSAFFDLAWLSRDFAAAARVAEDSETPTWTFSRGNSVLPRRLRLAWAYTAMGEADKARGLYTDIHTQYQAAVRERPGDWDRHMALGLAAAGLGLKEEAVAEGRQALEMLPITRDAFAGPEYLVYLAQLYVSVGENDQAIALLQQVMSIPAGLSMSSALLKLDPTWDPLRADPRFDALVKQGENNTAHG